MSISYIPLLNYGYMPVGLYTRKGAKGRRMYFRDGKLISKKVLTMPLANVGDDLPRKGMRRKTARRAYMGKRSRRTMRKSIPHPSVTGMASGLAIAAYLNQGKETTTQTGIAGVGQVATMGEGVIKDITDGELGKSI